VARLAALTGRPAEVRHADPRPGDVPHSQADISLARTTLGYEPAVEFSTGLAKTVEDWKDGRMEGWKDGGWEDCRLTQLYELYKPGPVR
jgi:nucleoside-diphosphate-sugar epimerase